MDPLESHVTVETPEQVSLTFSIAGIGSRSAAAMIDGAIILVAVFLLWTVGGGALLSAVRKVDTSMLQSEKMLSWAYSILILLTFGVVFGYNILLEGLMDGQTIGKRILRLRVVKDGGLPITLSESAIRNVLRFIDYLPGVMPIVGGLSIIISRSGKRLGDIVAGTIVVKELRTDVLVASHAHVTSTVEARKSGAKPSAKLTDKEFSFLELYINRRSSLSENIRQQYISDITTRFKDKLDTKAFSDAAAIVHLYENEREARYSGVSVRSDDNSIRESLAIVASKAHRWTEFSTQLDGVKKKGLANLNGEEVSKFADNYRAVSNDLAQLQTASRGKTSNSVYYLSRLVASAHSILYRQKKQTFSAVINFIVADIPKEIRRSWLPVLLAMSMFMVPAAATYVLILQKPERADRFVGIGMKLRAEEGIKRKKEGKGYIEVGSFSQPILASGVITNNIRVSAMAFASGITAGIGTALVLITNGVSISSSVAYYHTKDILDLILLFIAPHGVLELFAVFLTGGGGFLIAAAILFPKHRSRKQAFIENGKRAVTLLAGAVLLMFIAGVIEGNVSPRVWPVQWKTWFSIATAVFLIGYIMIDKRITIEDRDP